MALTKPSIGSTGWGSSVNQNWTDIESAFNALSQGRLTLTSGTPVTTSNVTGASTVYFTPYRGAWTALYNGTNWQLYNFSEISLALSGLTSGKNYDVFLYDNSGTLTLILGPAWSSDTSRGTGAGTTELVLQDGVWVNKVDISSGPTAKKGRYLGTIRTTGTTTTEDSDSKRYVWNANSRTMRFLKAVDTTDSWTYTTASWRAANNNTTDGVGRFSLVIGLSEDVFNARNTRMAYNGYSLPRCPCGIGVDSTSTNSAQISTGASFTTGSFEVIASEYFGFPGIGYHYIQALERSEALGTTAWWGDDGGATGINCGMVGSILA